jgi:glycosyltransferase involved in cell wall biosynthesis
MNVDVSFVIPVYNEEAILQPAVLDLRESFGVHRRSYEILLAENGSTDGTVRVLEKLSAKFGEVRFLSISEPNYGRALRAGIEAARGGIVVCEEIDLCDADFHSRALAILDRGDADLVVGSKLLAGAEDARPFTRHAASLVYSGLLRATMGYRGTDTHGLKAMRRETLLPIVESCLVDRDVFASELVIRAQRAGLRLNEIPVRVMEKRVPSINLIKRVPGVIRRLGSLYRALGREDRLG